MTGFGRAEAQLGTRRVVAEVRSVNHRFLELKVRLGRDDGELEAELTKAVRGRLERGAVTLTLREEVDEGDAPAEALVDEGRARAWMDTLRRLGAAIGAEGAPTLGLVCAQPGVLRARASESPRPAFVDAARTAVARALDALADARAREGEGLGRELDERLASLRRLMGEVARLSAGEPAAHQVRLTQRVAALLSPTGATVDPQRLAQEIALLAERLDVTEELVRLGAHLDEARRLLAGDGPSGRRLDFLAQEIHREVNTIGSKAQSAEIAARVVDLKAELERFREQVQNLE